MTENEAVKELKDGIELCYEQSRGYCSGIKNNICTCKDAIILSALDQYRSIGTVEECREAREKQRTKKPKGRYKMKYIWDAAYCPACGCGITARWNFCQGCGQAIDWSNTL